MSVAGSQRRLQDTLRKHWNPAGRSRAWNELKKKAVEASDALFAQAKIAAFFFTMDIAAEEVSQAFPDIARSVNLDTLNVDVRLGLVVGQRGQGRGRMPDVAALVTYDLNRKPLRQLMLVEATIGKTNQRDKVDQMDAYIERYGEGRYTPEYGDPNEVSFFLHAPNWRKRAVGLNPLVRFSNNFFLGKGEKESFVWDVFVAMVPGLR